MTKALAALLALSVAAWTLPANAMTPADLVEQVASHEGKVSYEGHRVQLLTRQTMSLRAAMQVNYRDAKNYRVVVQDPGKLANVNVWLARNDAHVYFPDENLLFRNDNPSGSTEVAETIFGQITSAPDLLYRNYNLRIIPDEEARGKGMPVQVAARDCHILDVVPKGGYVVPGHRYWIDRQTFQILREDRTWGAGMSPYFESAYDEFVPTSQLDLEVRVPRDVNAVELKSGSKDNSYLSYRSIEAAEQALGQPLPRPAHIPAGFQLASIQLPVFYGTRLTLMAYTDGVNWLYIQYRPKPTLWVTLLAGSFAVKLVEKFQELSYQAPFNYYGAEKGEAVLFVYGDLYPDELQRVGDSLPLKQPRA